MTFDAVWMRRGLVQQQCTQDSTSTAGDAQSQRSLVRMLCSSAEQEKEQLLWSFKGMGEVAQMGEHLYVPKKEDE